MRTRRRTAGIHCEPLERRRLFAATVEAPISGTFVSGGAGTTPIDLTSAFSDPAVTLIDLTTNVGPIDLSLTSLETPKTVANFLRYVTSGIYTGSIIHRVTAGFVMQGGGYNSAGTALPALPAIPSEASGTSNVTGTIAMGLSVDLTTKMTDPNSATDQWFINLTNNASLNGTYTAFGTVIDGTMSTVSAISSLPQVNGEPALDPTFSTDDGKGPFTNLPVLNAASPITPANLVAIENAQVISPLSYSATSDDPSLVNPSIAGGTLMLAYPTPGATGTAHITVTANDSIDGSSASQTFTAEVGSDPIKIGSGGARAVQFSDAGGEPDTITLSGPGSASLIFTGTAITEKANSRTHVTTIAGQGVSIAQLSTVATNARSMLRFSAPHGGTVNVADLSCDSAIGSIIGPNVSLTQSLAIDGSINQLKLGAIINATVNATGSINSISLATARSSAIYAGVAPANPGTLPVTSAEFANKTSAIRSIAIGSDIASEIAAYSIGRFSTQSISLMNSGTPFGLAAHTITSAIGRTTGGGRFNLHQVTGDAVVASELQKEKISLEGDDLTFQII